MENTFPSPKQIDILILDDATMLTAASVIDPLRAANRLSDKKLFNWKIHSKNGAPIRLMGGFLVAADNNFSKENKADC